MQVTGRGRDSQPGAALWARPKAEISRRAVPASSTSTSRTISKRRWPGCIARVGGEAGVHAAAVPAGARAVRPVRPRAPPRRQALRAARLHHGRRRAVACRATCVSCAVSWIPATCRSTCRAKSCSRIKDDRGHPFQRLRRTRCSACSKTWRKKSRRNTRRSGRSSAAC